MIILIKPKIAMREDIKGIALITGISIRIWGTNGL